MPCRFHIPLPFALSAAVALNWFGTAFGQTEVVVPHVVVGTLVEAQRVQADYRTVFRVLNQAGVPVRLRIELWDDDGVPLRGFLEGGFVGARHVSELTRPLSGYGSQEIATAPTFPVRAGWARITVVDFVTGTPLDAAISVSTTLLCLREGRVTRIATLFPSQPRRGFSAVAKTDPDGATGLALLNPSPTETAEVTIYLVSVSALPQGSRTISLQPLQKIARFLNDEGLFEELPSFNGTMEIRSTQPVAAAVIQSGDTYWNSLGTFPPRAAVPIEE